MDDGGATLTATMTRMGLAAREAARALRLATPATRTAAIQGMADAIRRRAPEILAANARDLARAGSNGHAPVVLRPNGSN